MATVEEVESLIRACLGNAEKLLEAAKLVAKPGSNHISYHLTVLALEEIGKSSLIFVDSIRTLPPPSTDGETRRSPLDWIEDHEQKIFWAIWLPEFGEDRSRPWPAMTFCSSSIRSGTLNPNDSML